MDVESLAKQLILQNMTPEQQKAVLESVRATLQEARGKQKQRVSENVGMVVDALKKIEADIRAKYDDLGNKITTRVNSIRDGRDGANGSDGRDGLDGRPGRDGAQGPAGPAGRDGVNGIDGVDGVSVIDAKIDFDGSLIISLSNGREINVGEVVAADVAEKIRVVANGGGTSQTVIDALASLQTQINNLIPSQTGNAGKFLTTNGSALSWSSVAGGLSYQGTWNASTNTPTLTSSVGVNGYYYIVATAGSTNLNGITDWQIGDWLMFNGSVWQKIDQSNLVTSVNGQTGAVSLTYTDVGAFPATSTTGTGDVVLATGATQSNPTISNYQNLTPITAPAYQEGRVWYDSTAKALSFYADVSGIDFHVGHDLQFKVINNTGSTIANGAPVYITGTSSGQTYPNVALAKADVAATSAVIGLTDGPITNGSVGYVTSIGNIDDVNTGSFTVGQVLYLSPYSAGQLMNTIPPTGITVQVGVVTFVNSSTGKIYVKQTTPLNVPASIISGTLAVNQGGTGQVSALVAGSVVYGVSTTAMGVTAAGTSGQVLTSAGAGTPTWTTPTAGTVTSVSGTGTVNGISLSGTVTSSGSLTLGGTLSGTASLNIDGTVGATTPAAGTFTDLTANNSAVISVNTSGNALRITQTGTGNALVVEDDTNPDSTPFVITADGRVITGATQAYAANGETQQLQVQGLTQASSSALLATWSTSAGSEPTLVLAHSRSGVIGTHTASVANDNLGNVVFCGSDGSAFNAGVAILAEADGTWTGSSTPAKLEFYTVPAGATVGIQAISITSGQGFSITRTAVTSPVANDGNVFSGTYTPSLANTTNITGSTPYACQYMRVGNVVTVSGRLNIDPTTSGAASEMGISLPITSDITATTQCAGTGSVSTTTTEVSTGGILGDTTNNRATFRFVAGGTAARDYGFTFTYLVN